MSFRSVQCKRRWLTSALIPEEEHKALDVESILGCKKLVVVGRSALYSDSKPCRVQGPLQFVFFD